MKKRVQSVSSSVSWRMIKHRRYEENKEENFTLNHFVVGIYLASKRQSCWIVKNNLTSHLWVISIVS